MAGALPSTKTAMSEVDRSFSSICLFDEVFFVARLEGVHSITALERPARLSAEFLFHFLIHLGGQQMYRNACRADSTALAAIDAASAQMHGAHGVVLKIAGRLG